MNFNYKLELHHDLNTVCLTHPIIHKKCITVADNNSNGMCFDLTSNLFDFNVCILLSLCELARFRF